MPNGVFFAFDMLAIDGENLRGLPAIERLMRLEYEAPCPVVRSTGSGLLAFYRAIIQNGGEGVVAKRASSLYRVGRSYDWLKVKPKYEVKNV
jgi:bifunctional non-homologous end joining protein LigD